MAPLRRLLSLLLVLCALGTAQAATYTFNTDKIDNCTRQGKDYSCTKLPLANEYDRIVIASGVTVTVSSDVWFGYNQALSMSGTAHLASSGNLSIADVAPSNLAITGGSFASAKTFTVGNQVHDIKADISAATLMLGSGSGLKITGKVVASGAVQIGSNTTITGAVEGGSIAIGTPVKIYGPVTSTGPVQIGSGAIIEGAIGGTVVTAGSPVTIKGNITATTSFTLDSGSTVTGDVDTGRLTIYASESTITGTAKVDSAVLYWHGKVAKTITCKKGTAPGKCDCVDNQSGWDVNTANGPRCEAGQPASGALHHFLIEHDGSAGTCTAKEVKVTACANAACTSTYAGGAQVVMQPGGAAVTIGGSGINSTAPVSSIAAGKIMLSLTQGGSQPAVSCRNTRTGSNSCEMEFTGGVNFKVSVPDHLAGDRAKALVQAVKANDANTACVPAFVGVSKKVDFSCNRVLPTTGDQGLTLHAGATSNLPLACNGGAKQALDANFDSNGTASIELSYPDAGKMELQAALDQITGKGNFVVAPYSFKLGAPTPQRAGLPFDLSVTALNKAGAMTKNFDSKLLGGDATNVQVSLACIANNGDGKLKGNVSAAKPDFTNGAATMSTGFDEVGRIDLNLGLKAFLGGSQDLFGTTRADANACAGAVGPFLPMYYQVELGDANRIVSKNGADFSYYYSDEPIPLRISAMNAQGALTVNYPIGYGSSDKFAFSARDKDGAALAANLGQLTVALTGDKFSAGIASTQARYRFIAAQTDPTVLRLRVETVEKPANEHTTSADGAGYADKTPEQARPIIRSGRLRIGSRFGPVGQDLDLPVTAEYWSGKSWTRNFDDDFTVIPESALALNPKPGAGVVKLPQLVDGEASLRLRRNSAGTIDAAINLGATNTDQSCLTSKVASTGAAMPWLQSRTGCIDPSGRATFGVQSPETRRSIHVREVYR